MSFVDEVSDSTLSSASRNLEFWCPDIDNYGEEEIGNLNTEVISRGKEFPDTTEKALHYHQIN